MNPGSMEERLRCAGLSGTGRRNMAQWPGTLG